MKAHNLIFSNQLQYRLTRHLLFWFTWWIFFEFTYFLPEGWYPGWNTSITPALVLQRGYLIFSLLVISNTFLSIVIHVFFTYSLIYFLMPRWLVKEKYFEFTLALTALLFISAFIFYFEFKYGNRVVRQMFGLSIIYWTHQELLKCSWNYILFNCPMVGGAALAIKLVKRWLLKQKEAQQLATAKASAELQLLKAQIHPHFLFNTLNNIYSFILNASPRAPQIVKKLSGLLHYIIYECNQPSVPLEKELNMLKDYMGLERIRYGEQMDMQIDIRGNSADKMIAPLLLIPFVENSFKHGTSKMLSRPSINLNIIIENERLYFMISNSKPEEYISPSNNKGIGLVNVQKRLRLLYPNSHELKMTEEPGHFTVMLEINIQPANLKTRKTKKAKHELV